MKRPSPSADPSAAREAAVEGMNRRNFLARTALLSGAVALGGGSYLLRARGADAATTVKIGIATDLTGAIAYAGLANANVAKMVVGDINASGGLLGRPIDLFIEDTASNEAIGNSKARKLVQRDRVDVVLGGITSSMRNAIKDEIIKRGRTLYIYPQLYEGKECTRYLYCTGPVPAQQVDPLVSYFIKERKAKTFYFPSADYVWPHVLNQYARKAFEDAGGKVVGEEYFPLDATDYSATIQKIMSQKVDVVFNTVIPPGVSPFFEQLYNAGFQKRGGILSCVYYDENALNITPAKYIEGLVSCLDYFVAVDDPFSKKLQAEYTKKFPGPVRFTAGSAATGMYRGLKFYQEAVMKAKSVERDAVADQMEHASISEGPGGPASIVPGHWHTRMNMYLAVAKSGHYEVLHKYPQMDPKEC